MRFHGLLGLTTLLMLSASNSFADGSISIVADPFASKCRKIILAAVGHQYDWNLTGRFDPQRDCFASGNFVSCNLKIPYTKNDQNKEIIADCMGNFFERSVTAIVIPDQKMAEEAGLSLKDGRLSFSNIEGKY